MFSTVFIEPTTITYDKDFSASPVKSYKFSKNIYFMPLVQTEVAQAAFDYPVLIAKTEEGVFPVALLSLKMNENLFINGNGAWEKESHIPTFLNTYPFMLTKAEWNKESKILYDAAYSGINKKDPASVEIIKDGQITQSGKKILDRLQDQYVNFEKTKQLFSEINAMGLLKKVEVKMIGEDVKQNHIVEGFYGVDTEKLNSLDDEKLLRLTKSGILSLIHFHLASFSNIQKLKNRLA